MKIENKNIESKIGNYVVGKEHSLPLDYISIGNKLDYYKKEIAQNFIFTASLSQAGGYGVGYREHYNQRYHHVMHKFESREIESGE